MQHIFVGDVQGCGDELDELIDRVRAEFADRFELWLVGDLVNRGPYSLRVLRRARELVDGGRGRVVLGNHDVGLLETAAGHRPLGPRDSFGDVLEAPDARDWMDWLRGLPVALGGRLGEQGFAMVHASVHPDWGLGQLERHARLVEQRLADPERGAWQHFLSPASQRSAERDVLGRLTRARSVDAAGGWSDALPGDGSEPWHRAWSRRGHDYGVVYGHWALQGLHVEAGLRGLDTGCVHHGRDHEGALTAWLPDPGCATPFEVPDDRFWRIPARRVYYRYP